MGYTRAAFEWLFNLYQDNLFEGFDSVLELGSQAIYHAVDQSLLLEYSRRLNKSSSSSIEFSVKSFYEMLGFKTYNSIDTDGARDAFIFDLNKVITKEYDFSKTFDLVANLGTTEHVFNQGTAFKNIHNLTSLGGLMAHWTPVYGWINHGFYQLSPILFEDLAVENDYKILKRQLIIREGGVKNEKIIDVNIEEALKPGSLFGQSVKPGLTMMYICIMKKQSSETFKTPFQGIYRKINKATGYKTEWLTLSEGEKFFQAGNEFKKNKKIEEAISAYKRALELDPHKAEYYQNLAESLAEANQFEEAIDYYQRAIQNNSKWFKPYYYLGVALEKKNQTEAAIENYKKATQLNPNFAWSYYNMGNLYARKGLLDEAEDCYKLAISVHPPSKSFFLYLSLGDLLIKQNKADEARVEYNKARKIDPTSTDINTRLARLDKKFDENIQ